MEPTITTPVISEIASKYPIDPRKSLVQRHKRIMKAIDEIDNNMAFMYQVYEDFKNTEHCTTLTELGKILNVFESLLREFRREM